MGKFSSIFLRACVAWLFLAMPACVLGWQEADSLGGARYFERADNGMVRFFYDRHYYLVDRDCHYKEIEREGHFDFENRRFVGAVRDFDLDGGLVMEGNYTDGKKDGWFRGYHPSGFLKWEIHYVDDLPVDTLRYFYPDGMPYLEYRVVEDELLLWSYWNKKGKQRVKNGQGRFELISEASDAYNDIGYRWVKRRGRVRAGKMHQQVFYRYLFEDGTEYTAGYEAYHHGKFLHGEDYAAGTSFYGPRHAFGPRIWHVRSESLVSKQCTVDDHIGFTHYAAEMWQLGLGARATMTTNADGQVILYLKDEAGQWQETPYMASDMGAKTLSFVLQVDKEGAVQSVVPNHNFETPGLAEHMAEVVQGFRYWVPSWDGDFIDDELTVRVEVLSGAGNPFFVLYDMHVARKEGS